MSNISNLNRLSELPVPVHRPQAKTAALKAALDAFESAKGTDNAVQPHPHAFGWNPRSGFYAVAASVAVLAIAFPLCLHFLKPDSPRGPEPPSHVAGVPSTIGSGNKIAAGDPSGSREVLLPSLPSLKSDPSAAVDRVARDRTVSPETLRQAIAEATRNTPLLGLLEKRGSVNERFAKGIANPVKSVASEPVSTFSVDIDTAAYSYVRRALNAGYLPLPGAVRIEEMINYFPYAYPRPEKASTPFAPAVTVVPAPWNPQNKLVHIGIQGYDIRAAERPRANLVLLIDTSGSMAPEDRLPLLKTAFSQFMEALRADDTVAVVTYAGQSHVALEPTKVADKAKILQAIQNLEAGGSTAGEAGIQKAYALAEAAFDSAAVNRIILATDGDFNVGITSVDELKSYIASKRKTGIYLSILGVGRDNYNDALMQALAQNGNGIAAYIDTLNEARKVLVDQAASTLFPIANDVKIQVEFNPGRVSEYRLIGYETRLLRREDFKNDKVDAGEVGSGHTVTAIYEITPVGSPKLVENLRYGAEPGKVVDPARNQTEYGFLKIRYKLPGKETSEAIDVPIGSAQEKPDLADTSDDVRFSISVAAFGQILRDEPYIGSYNLDSIIALAAAARGDDPFGYRAEFVQLVRAAKSARR